MFEPVLLTHYTGVYPDFSVFSSKFLDIRLKYSMAASGSFNNNTEYFSTCPVQLNKDHSIALDMKYFFLQ
jgi:hypothetical protein